MKITKTERILISPGYRQAYQPVEADPPRTKENARLRNLKRGQTVKARQVRVRQRPTGMTEAQLLRELEFAGIGRPSTYAGIVRDLLQHSYVRQDGQQIIITPRGLEVQAYLSQAFPRLFDLGFSARMETWLDAIAQGKSTYKRLISEVWHLVEKA